MDLAVVGAGWAGLAAAVRARQAGHAVTLIEMARQPGGRARTVELEGERVDNGQHILIGAYTRTLDLMATVGADAKTLLDRRPLTLRHADGRGLALPPGPALPAFVRAVLACRGWSWGDRAALLWATLRWSAARFRCDPGLTVSSLCRDLPPRVRSLLIDPLCVAALNTPADMASAQVLLTVLHDAVFAGAGSADLLLPRRSLSELLPEPALAWLEAAGARVHFGQRVMHLAAEGGGWRVDGRRHDAVILACSAAEAARLAAPLAPDWARTSAALHYEPIVTAYLRCPGARLAAPLLALEEGPEAPAQFAFDLGAIGGPPGVFSFVVSGAQPWVERGLPAIGAAVLKQARSVLPAASLWRILAEKRATFRCTPGLQRPPSQIAPRLHAAGDYVEGPYPATIEGAVRSGEFAAKACATGR